MDADRTGFPGSVHHRTATHEPAVPADTTTARHPTGTQAGQGGSVRFGTGWFR